MRLKVRSLGLLSTPAGSCLSESTGPPQGPGRCRRTHTALHRAHCREDAHEPDLSFFLETEQLFTTPALANTCKGTPVSRRLPASPATVPGPEGLFRKP